MLPVLVVGLWASLLARSGLHAAAGVANLEGEFLAFEASAGQSAGSVIVVLQDGRIVVRWLVQVYYLRGHFGDHSFALQDADFHVRTAAVPL